MDFSSLLSNSGISIGKLTLAVVLQALAVLAVGVVLIHVLLSLLDRAFARSEKLAPLKRHVRPLVKTLLGVVLALVVLGSLGVQVTSFIALLSVAGLAVSLALQNTLANIAGGIMILTAQPYGVGDYIAIGDAEGTVDMIRLSNTRLITLDNKLIQIPNSTVAAATVTNFTRLGKRRIDLTLTASYDAPTEAVYAALRGAMTGAPQVLATPAPEAHIADYGESSIAYLARFWVKAGDYWDAYYAVLEAVRGEFAAHGVEMTYNHLNVHLMQEG